MTKQKKQKKQYQHFRLYRETVPKWKAIAKHYGMSVIKLLDEVAQKILEANNITYQEDKVESTVE